MSETQPTTFRKDIRRHIEDMRVGAANMNALADQMHAAGGIAGDRQNAETIEDLDRWRAEVISLYRALSRVSDAMWLYVPEEMKREAKR